MDSTKNGLILSSDDSAIRTKAESLGLKVSIDSEYSLKYKKCLYTKPGVKVPWDLLPAAWHFLNRWDIAIPLFKYGVTAGDLGTAEERKRTKDIVKDLRVLVHSVELLFVRNNESGAALLNQFNEELKGGGNEKLAFLRAYYITKPIACILPTSWLADVSQVHRQLVHRNRGRRQGSRLVTVEISPGKWVKCNPGDEEKVFELMQNQNRRR